MTAETDALVELSFAVQDALVDAAAGHGLSLTQLRMLGILRDREPAMADLAEFMRLRRSSVSGLVDRAEARGLVERTPAAHDGRGVHVRLSRAGRRLAKVLEAEVDERMAALLAELGE